MTIRSLGIQLNAIFESLFIKIDCLWPHKSCCTLCQSSPHSAHRIYIGRWLAIASFYHPTKANHVLWLSSSLTAAFLLKVTNISDTTKRETFWLLLHIKTLWSTDTAFRHQVKCQYFTVYCVATASHTQCRWRAYSFKSVWVKNDMISYLTFYTIDSRSIQRDYVFTDVLCSLGCWAISIEA